MKKFTRTGKKALSVFLAALMVMTAWVFVAPTKAEATNGSYWLNVKVNVTNKADKKENIQDSYWTITYRPNNGRGDEATMKYDLREKEYGVLSNESDNQYMHVSVPGFPTKIYYYHDATWNDKVYYKLCDIYVSSKKENGGIVVNSPNKKIESGGWGNSEVKGNISWDDGSKYPYVATSKSISTATAASNIGIPPLGDKKDVSTSTTTMQYYTTDQYGVRYEPTSYTFSGVTGLTTSGSIGNAYTATATESTTKSDNATYQTATVKLKWTNDKSTSSQHGDSTYTFKVYNPRYKVTYSGNGGNLGTNYTYAYLNQKVSADSSTATSNNVAGLTAEKFPMTGSREGYTFNGIWSAASGGTQYSADTKVTKNSTAYAHWTPIKYNAEFKGNRATYPYAVQEYLIANVATDFDSKPVAPTNVEKYDDGDYQYTFNGNWKDSSGNVYTAATLPIMTTAGATYKAQYNGTFVQADYSGVTAQENEAARIKSNPNYEAIYTPSSRNTLQAALDAVVTGKGRTQQDVVDGYEQRIKEAIEALEGQKYSVVFMDGRDNSIIKFSYPNVFGDTIQYPANPSMSYDKNYHYTFNKWEGTAQETNLSTVEKNITIVARFNKAEHNFTEEHIDSTCVKQGGTKYTCTTCGYSYTTYSGTYGDHVWSTDWTIDNPATCTQPGSKSHHCTLCTATKDATAIPALGHDYTGVEPEIIVPVSCDTIGVSIRECTRCGYNDYITTDPIGHKMKDEVTAPTCTSKGYTTSTCEVCGKTLIGSFTDPIAHNYVKKDSECVAPSCVGVGYDVSYCSICGLKKYDIISAKGHSWNKEQTIDIEPTCTTKGQKSIHCSVCDVISTDTVEEIPANGHSYDSGEVLAPATCTQDGVKAYQCTVAGCGHTKTETIAKLGHAYATEFTTDYAATCISDGQQSKHCTREGCEAKTEITVIEKRGHNTTITTTPATCTEVGRTVEKCSRCDYEKTTNIQPSGHNFVETEPVAATCGDAGHVTMKCNVCGESYVKYTAPATGKHTWDYKTEQLSHDQIKVTATCSSCKKSFETTVSSTHAFGNIKTADYQPATCIKKGSITINCGVDGCTESHVITIPESAGTHTKISSSETKKATCTEDGKVEVKCDDCTDVIATVTIPAKGHDYSGNYKEYVASTCTKQGHITYECKNDCGTDKEETLPIDSDAHNFVPDIHHPATCTMPEYNEFICLNGCSKTYIKFGEEEATGHKWTVDSTSQSGTRLTITCKCSACRDTHSETVTVAEGHNYTTVTSSTAATCKKAGSITIACDKKHDSSCTAVITVAVPEDSTAHDYEFSYTPPTCQTEGSVVVKCKDCGVKLHEDIVIAKLEHSWNDGEVTTKADCDKNGEKLYTCTVDGCGATKTEVIPMTGHTWNSGEHKSATCTMGGYTHFTCTVCDKTYDVIDEGASAAGHTWNGGTETKAATCTTDGEKLYTCLECDATRTEPIPKLGHKWDNGTKHNATCTSSGYTEFKCENDCGESYKAFDENAKATDHKWSDWNIVTEATNTTAGEMERICPDCGKKETALIPAGNHEFDMDNPTVDVPATCLSEGKTTYKCRIHDDCGVEITVTTAKIPHTFKTEVIPATCTKEGKVKTYCVNDDCGEEILVILPLVQHTYDDGVVTPATCTERAYTTYTCNDCGYTRVVFDETTKAKGHNFTQTKSTATCTAAGTITVSCEACGISETVNVPALGHDFVATDEVVASTCKEVGYKKYQCSNDGCDVTTTVYEATFAEHQFGDWEVVTEATTDKAGLKIRTCSVCELAEKATISPIGDHKFEKVEGGYIAPTCTTEGSQRWYCTKHENCSANYTEVIPATEHTPVADEATPATCTGEGKTAGSHCSVCNEVIVAQQTIPAKNHNYGSTPTDYVAATCQNDGSVTLKCNDCEAEMTVIIEKNSDAHKMVIDAENSQKATCKQAAYTAYKCDNEGCTYTYKQWTKDPIAHTAGDWSTKEEATCASAGYKVKTCTVCGTILETAAIPANSDNHNYKKVTVDGTHFKSGYTYNLCEVCGKIDNIEVSEIEKHSYNKLVEKVDPTAYKDGYAIYECECKDRIEVILPKEGCDYDEAVTKQPTCTEKGETTYTCKLHPDEEPIVKANIPALGHDGKIEVKPATCTEDGYAKIVCTRDDCGAELANEVLDVTQHTFSKGSYMYVPSTCISEGSVTYKCTNPDCDETLTVEIPKAQHTYAHGTDPKDTVEPTCTDNGYDVYRCTTKGCDSSYNVITKPANGHKFTKEDESKYDAPTCSEVGHKYFVCAACGEEGYDYDVPATGIHDYSVSVSVPADCENAGYSYNKCECGAVDETSAVVKNPLGHSYTVKVDDNTMQCSRCEKTITIQKSVTDEENVVHALVATVTKESTCTVHGEVVYTCQNHKDCAQNKTEELPLAAHAAKAGSVETVAPVCKKDGTTVDGYVLIKCAACDEEIERITIAASHSYKVDSIERATCSSNGKVIEKCEKCGHTRETEIKMNLAAHDFSGEPFKKVPATCTTEGYEVYNCRNEGCNVQKFYVTAPMIGHQNTKKETKAASCKADGYERTICNDCKRVLKETVIPATGHKEYEYVTVEAKCETAGSKTTKCAKCGEIISVEVVNPTGHKWGEWENIGTVSCETGGTARRECTVCHKSEEKTTPKGEHTYDEGVVVPATCTKNGYTKYTCTKCGHSYIASYTPMTDHNYSGAFVVIIEPTCHSTGSKVQKCIYCGDINPDSADHNYTNIPRLNHNYGEWEIIQDATCDQNGLRQRTCQNEGCPEGYDGHVQKEIISKIGHNYGDWTVTKPANCTETGIKERTCDRCKYTEKAVIEKGSHKTVVDNAVEATCTSTGLTAGNHCEICGAILVAQKVIPMKAHMDLNGDGKCDKCSTITYQPGKKDTCLCHKTGFGAIFYKIALVFWKLFRIKQTCVCGAKHWEG